MISFFLFVFQDFNSNCALFAMVVLKVCVYGKDGKQEERGEESMIHALPCKVPNSGMTSSQNK